MINSQPIEKQVHNPQGWLDIIKQPWLTIQGEGPFAGDPAVFVRLAGCNLQCELCDTDYTNNRKLTPPENVVLQVVKIARQPLKEVKLVVITGGEPFRQNLRPFVLQLLKFGHVVQIETNGTMYPPQDLPWNHVTVVCCPKTPVISYDLPINAFKYVLEAGHVDPQDGLPTSVLGKEIRPARPPEEYEGKIYLQPVDEGNPTGNNLNTEAVKKSCLQFGYTVCLQVQKILGVE